MRSNKMLRAWTTILAVTLALIASPVSAQVTSYRLIFEARLPGDNGWDYVSFDSKRKLVFIGRPDGVLAVGADSGQLIARIGSNQGNHGAVTSDDLDRVFTSESNASSIGVYDLSTLQRLATVKLQSEPDALLYDAPRKWLVVMSRKGGSLTVIDAQTYRVLRTIPLGGPVEAAAMDENGQLFVDLPNSGEVARVDLVGGVTARWSVAPCQDPSSLAIDRAAHRLFVGCRNKLIALVNSDSGAVLSAAPIGAGTDSMVFNTVRRTAISSNGDGTMSLVPERSPAQLGPPTTVVTARGARTMAEDPVSGRLFLVTADIGSVDPQLPGQERPTVHYVPGTFRILVYSPF